MLSLIHIYFLRGNQSLIQRCRHLVQIHHADAAIRKYHHIGQQVREQVAVILFAVFRFDDIAVPVSEYVSLAVKFAHLDSLIKEVTGIAVG